MPIKHALPDERGRFGQFGGRFVPETLMHALEQLEDAYREAREDEAFQADLERLLHLYAGRPTPLYHAENLTAELGGAQVYLKREDLAHGHCLCQAQAAVRWLYGGRGHSASVAERVSHANAGRRGTARGRGKPDAKGRYQRVYT